MGEVDVVLFFVEGRCGSVWRTWSRWALEEDAEEHALRILASVRRDVRIAERRCPASELDNNGLWVGAERAQERGGAR